MFGYMSVMSLIIPILVGAIFIFTFIMIFSPKVRAKMMGKQIKATKYMIDENKGTAVRQCLASLSDLLVTKKELSTIIKKKLLEIDCTKYKDTLAPLIKKDISNILNQLDVDSPLRG